MTFKPLKIGVLTFHRCINYGSYWQARCLVEGLRARGHGAVLLDHACDTVRSAELRCAFQPLLPTRSPRSDLKLYAAKVRRFEAAFADLPLSTRFPLDRPEEAGHHDMVVIGSDEVWNLSHPWYGHQRAFYGVGLRADRLVSYAASFGSYDAARGLQDDRAEMLRRFDAIAVRDRNAEHIARSAGVAPTTVLDPVLQFPPEVAAPREGEPYALVYGHNFPDWFRDHTRAWAKARALPLVSVGYRNPWADRHAIDAGPLEFAELVAGASAMMTNFFHGCVFALVNDKPVACASSAYRANKLADLTDRLGVCDRLLDEAAPASAYAAALETPPAAQIGPRLAAMRAQSSAYLDRVTAA